MNDRIASMPLASARLGREQVELQIEKAKLDARQGEVVRFAELLDDGHALYARLMAALSDMGDEIAAKVGPREDETHVHGLLTEVAYGALTRLADEVKAEGRPHQRAVAAGLRPRRLLTVSEWSDAKRELKTGTANPGPWHTAFVPYLREIMDCLSAHSPMARIVFMKSSQVGGTEVLLNWIGYVMEHAPAEMLMVMPSLDLRRRFHVRRFQKLVGESPALAALFGGDPKRAAGNSEDLTVFPGGTLIKAGANSPNSLRSDAVRYVACDEVDGFEWDVGGEGDPLELIENRQRTYSRRKTFLCSTPTQKGSSRIEQEYLNSDRRRYHVACPHCGEFQALWWKHFSWRSVSLGAAKDGEPERKRVTAAWMDCAHCGAQIDESDKTAMLATGRWIAEVPGALVRGYHINALYSPMGMGLRWVHLAQKWIDAQQDTSKLKAFVNTYLGETWEEEGDAADPALLIARLETYPVEIRYLAVTAGADVQKDRIEVTFAGWGVGEECWVLDHVILPGDTAQPAVWADLAMLFEERAPDVAAIDSGYNTSMVYAFVAERRYCYAIKGMDGSYRPLVEDAKARARRLRGQRKKGIQVHIVGTDQGKGLVNSRLALPKPGHGYVHFPATDAFDHEYFAQLAAEKLVRKIKNGRPIHEWVQLRPRNEALDCFLYAMAALYLGGIDLAALEERRRNPPVPKAPVRTKSTGLGSEGWVL